MRPCSPPPPSEIFSLDLIKAGAFCSLGNIGKDIDKGLLAAGELFRRGHLVRGTFSSSGLSESCVHSAYVGIWVGEFFLSGGDHFESLSLSVAILRAFLYQWPF